jgi:hypothetical protein
LDDFYKGGLASGFSMITDLSHHPSLWASFLFTKPIFAPDEDGLSFGGVIDTLLADDKCWGDA